MYSICAKNATITGEKILIYGGSGSLGQKTIKRWISDNVIINVSRDEEKQWNLQSTVNNGNLTQVIGDISNPNDVDSTILEHQPTIVCIFACLKHIELCEKFPQKAMAINTNGIINVYNTLLKYTTRVHTVLFVSTDKACMPITTYGCTKAISEFFLQNINCSRIKWVGVRYGNVLNSSGSIIPYLQNSGPSTDPYKLTHESMTRFIMTLDQSVNLIEHALVNGKHNELVIPFLKSMHIKDLFDLYASKYNKKIVLSGLRCKEKIHEDLLSVSEAINSYINGEYIHVTKNTAYNSITPFDSSKNTIDKTMLNDYLQSLNLI